MQPRINMADENKKKVLVVSIDYDGCLGNAVFSQAFREHIIDKNIPQPGSKDYNENDYNAAVKLAMRAANQAIIADIKQRADGYDEVIVMVGSNRQNINLDTKNSLKNNNGSCYPSMTCFAEVLAETPGMPPVKVNNYLVFDSILGQEHGRNYSVRELSDSEKRALHEADTIYSGKSMEQKYRLAYFQIQLIAEEHKNDEIAYVFYDDLPSILKTMEMAFGAKDAMESLPPNLTSFNVCEYTDAAKHPDEVIHDLRREYSNKPDSELIPDRNVVRETLTNVDILFQQAEQFVTILKSQYGGVIDHVMSHINVLVDEKAALRATELKDVPAADLRKHPKWTAVFDELTLLEAFRDNVIVNSETYLTDLRKVRHELQDLLSLELPLMCKNVKACLGAIDLLNEKKRPLSANKDKYLEPKNLPAMKGMKIAVSKIKHESTSMPPTVNQRLATNRVPGSPGYMIGIEKFDGAVKTLMREDFFDDNDKVANLSVFREAISPSTTRKADSNKQSSVASVSSQQSPAVTARATRRNMDTKPPAPAHVVSNRNPFNMLGNLFGPSQSEQLAAKVELFEASANDNIKNEQHDELNGLYLIKLKPSDTKCQNYTIRQSDPSRQIHAALGNVSIKSNGEVECSGLLNLGVTAGLIHTFAEFQDYIKTNNNFDFANKSSIRFDSPKFKAIIEIDTIISTLCMRHDKNVFPILYQIQQLSEPALQKRTDPSSLKIALDAIKSLAQTALSKKKDYPPEIQKLLDTLVKMNIAQGNFAGIVSLSKEIGKALTLRQ